MSHTPFNVASHLARMAAEFPARVAIHFPRRGVKPVGESEHLAITFDQLNADADAIAHGLVAAGITRGSRTVLMVPPSPDFFALTFALFKVAAVPVLIDPGMGLRNLGKCLAEAEPEAFIGIAKAQAARRVLGWGKKTVRTTVNAGAGDSSATRRWPVSAKRASRAGCIRFPMWLATSRQRFSSPAAAPALRRGWCTRTATSRRRSRA